MKVATNFWSVGAAAAIAVFDGGRRRAVSDQARAAYARSDALYRETVLVAFREVEDNLAALRILEQEATTQAAAGTCRGCPCSSAAGGHGLLLVDIETNTSYAAHDRLLRMWLCDVLTPITQRHPRRCESEPVVPL